MTCPVSVIIPVKDDPRIFDCVESVLACADEAARLQVIVVENGSRPEFVASLEGLPPGLKVLNLPEPHVYPARNRAVEEADGELILFTDADCRVRPGWVAAAIACAEGGADIIQGHSGAISTSVASRLIQARYEAHLRRVEPGDGTECDTRNLAVRRAVFDSLRFNESFHRVGDTEFGLLAEEAGMRVAYCPEMQIEHDHNPDFRLFAAKQICHGWGAQRIVQSHPGVRWHGGHMTAVGGAVSRVAKAPGREVAARIVARACIAGAGGFGRVYPRMPFGMACAALTLIDKAAGLAGHLLYEEGGMEPGEHGARS